MIQNQKEINQLKKIKKTNLFQMSKNINKKKKQIKMKKKQFKTQSNKLITKKIKIIKKNRNISIRSKVHTHIYII